MSESEEDSSAGRFLPADRADARATLWMQKRDLAIDELTTEDDAAKAADQPLVMRSS
ncbi:hypothetical protein V6G86_001437 [Burkholderia multivorans]